VNPINVSNTLTKVLAEGKGVTARKSLTEACVVIKLEDGSLKAFSSEEDREHLAAMSPDVRALYEIIE